MDVLELGWALHSPGFHYCLLCALRIKDSILHSDMQTSGLNQIFMEWFVINSLLSDTVMAFKEARMDRENISSWMFLNGVEQISIEKSTGKYFVAHDYSAPSKPDYRHYLEKGLSALGIKPFYADDITEAKHILRKICELILSANIGIYDISSSLKHNVFIELGIAIASNRPFLITCHHDSINMIPGALRGLDILEYPSYSELERLIKDKAKNYLENTEEDDAFTRLFAPHRICPNIYRRDIQKSFLISDGPSHTDVRISVTSALESHDFQICNSEPSNQLALCALMDQVSQSSIGLYHISSNTTPQVFLQLGLAIGMAQSWLMILPRGTPIPSDLQGFDRIEFNSSVELGRDLRRRLPSLIAQLRSQKPQTSDRFTFNDLQEFIQYQISLSKMNITELESNQAVLADEFPENLDIQLEREKDRDNMLIELSNQLINMRESSFRDKMIVVRSYPDVVQMLPDMMEYYSLRAFERYETYFSDNPRQDILDLITKNRRKFLGLELRRADFLFGQVPVDLSVDLRLIQTDYRRLVNKLRTMTDVDEYKALIKGYIWTLNTEEYLSFSNSIYQQTYRHIGSVNRKAAKYGGISVAPAHMWFQLREAEKNMNRYMVVIARFINMYPEVHDKLPNMVSNFLQISLNYIYGLHSFDYNLGPETINALKPLEGV